MQRDCQQCGTNFEITKSDLEFYKKVSPSFGEIPPPTMCPECRGQRRMAWMNPMKLFQIKCDATQKTIVSHFANDRKNVVYGLEFWWSDDWDAKDYGKDYDFSRPFFEQFLELFQTVPFPALLKHHTKDENSAYTNQASYNKNCYLIFDSDFNRDCCYAYSLNQCVNVVDCYRVEKSELCYECIDCVNCYSSKYSQNSANCSNSLFLKNCIGCSDCFGCTNLRNKKYHINNKKYSKEEYFKKIEEIGLGNFNVVEENKLQFYNFSKNAPHKFMHGVQNENVRGNYLTNCKNAENCFDSRNLWDCKNIQQAFEAAKDCMDCTEIGIDSELLYECVLSGNPGNKNSSCLSCFPSLSDSHYCIHSIFSNDLFGCISMRRAKYCILNKQYTKAEYEELMPKIIEHMKSTGEWGEFFPVEISPFAYNETVAQEHYPMTKDEVLAKGWKWREEEDKIPDVEKVIPAERLPEDISDIPDDILNWAIKCKKKGRPFKIQKAELEFYRKQNLPIPHFHPDVRHEMRMTKRNPRKLWKRNCAECNIGIETTYAPDRPEKVLCEECYLKEVN